MKELTLLCTFCSGHLGHKVDSRGLPISPHLAGAPLPLPPVPAPFWLPPWLFLYNPLPKVLALLAPFFLFQSLVCPLALDGSHLCLPIPPAWTPLGVCLTHPCDPPVPGMHLAFCAVARLSCPGGPRGLPSTCGGSIWGADPPSLTRPWLRCSAGNSLRAARELHQGCGDLGPGSVVLTGNIPFVEGVQACLVAPQKASSIQGMEGPGSKRGSAPPACPPAAAQSLGGPRDRIQDWLLPTRARSALDTTLWQPLLRLGWAWEGTKQTQALLGCLPSHLLLPLPALWPAVGPLSPFPPLFLREAPRRSFFSAFLGAPSCRYFLLCPSV